MGGRNQRNILCICCMIRDYKCHIISAGVNPCRANPELFSAKWVHSLCPPPPFFKLNLYSWLSKCFRWPSGFVAKLGCISDYNRICNWKCISICDKVCTVPSSNNLLFKKNLELRSSTLIHSGDICKSLLMPGVSVMACIDTRCPFMHLI